MNEEQYGTMQAGGGARGGRRWHRLAIGAAVVVVAAIAWTLLRPSNSKVGVTLSIAPPAAPVQTGSEFTLDVLLDPKGYSPTAADLVITWDPKALEVVSIQPGELMPTELAKGALAEGTATITVASGTMPVTGGGTIARITFRAMKTGTSQVSLADGTQAAAAGYPGDVVGKLVAASVTVQ